MSEIIKKFIEEDAKSKLKIAILGDSMIDEYYILDVKRISPEAPIPVYLSPSDQPDHIRPGGALNVAYQTKNFNVDVEFIGMLNNQTSIICDIFNIKHKYSWIDEKCIVPIKKRFYSEKENGKFPLIRWDIERPNYGFHNLSKFLCSIYKKINCLDAEVFVFSDYNKGFFNIDDFEYIIENKITVVDPKDANIDKWKNCTVFKPNLSEALLISGKDNEEDAAIFLKGKLNCKAVVITRANAGVIVYDGEFYEIPPINPEEVQSVIGAGDCFCIFLAMGLGRGLSIQESAELAWEAGLLYVQNRYGQPISKLDLYQKYSGKMIDPELLADRDFKLVFTNGCFDILHAGHMQTIKFAKSLGDKLVVAVNTDNSISRLKTGRPFVSLEDRMKLLSSLEYVDYVVSFDESTPLEILKKIMPDVLVKGGDYKKEEVVGFDFIKEVVISPILEGLSTTSLVEKIKSS